MIAVACVGDLMVDVLATLPGPLAAGSDTPAPIVLRGGGAGANVAAWVAFTGGAASFVGRIGDDPLGQRARDELLAAGVDARLEVDPHRPTGTCIVLVDPSGERTMVPSAGANAAPADVAALLPAAADWLYLSGYTLLGEQSRPTGLRALQLARERGWSVAVDAASAAPLAADPAFLDRLGTDLLLFANADEATVLTGLAEPAAAAQALAVRCGSAVVKRGAAGAVWSDGSGVRVVPAPPVRVVDSTGAGDAFAAGFLTCPGDVPAALAAGVGLAARAVARLGGRPVPGLSR